MRDGVLPVSEGTQSRGLPEIASELDRLRRTLDRGLIGPGMGGGAVDTVRAVLDKHFRANGRWPGFLDICTNPFFDVYDWHVRNRLPIQMIMDEQRVAIQFMFTQLVVRWENPNADYIGIPYDR
jgi:hypothetical protein